MGNALVQYATVLMLSIFVGIEIIAKVPSILHTPLMFIDKASTWALANDLGGTALVDLIRTQTHTCYLGDRTRRHAWGAGCWTCDACRLRATGWAKWRDLPAP